MRGSLTSSINQEVKRRYGGANKTYRVYKIEKILRILIGGQRIDLRKGTGSTFFKNNKRL